MKEKNYASEKKHYESSKSSTKKIANPQQAARQAQSCDGCTTNISEIEALNCIECGVWLHRYCAGIPKSHYASIATLFICTACSLTTSKSIIRDLCDEIVALKAELLELKTAVEEIKSNEKQHVPNQVGGSETGGR